MFNKNKQFVSYVINFALALMLFSQTTHAGTDVYVTRDANGNPVFSDTPSEAAEKIIIKEIQTVEEPKAVTLPDSSDPRIKQAVRYETLDIISPQSDEAIRNNAGNIMIQVALKPGLGGDDVILITLDGKEVSRGSATSVALNNLDRGSHQVSAAVISRTGARLLKSDVVEFHLLRTSVLNQPAPQPNPPPANN